MHVGYQKESPHSRILTVIRYNQGSNEFICNSGVNPALHIIGCYVLRTFENFGFNGSVRYRLKYLRYSRLLKMYIVPSR
jgi:hypothetical protein